MSLSAQRRASKRRQLVKDGELLAIHVHSSIGKAKSDGVTRMESNPAAPKQRRHASPHAASGDVAEETGADSDDSDWTPYHLSIANHPLPLPPPQPPPHMAAPPAPAQAAPTAHTAPEVALQPADGAPARASKRSLTLDEWVIRKRRNI